MFYLQLPKGLLRKVIGIPHGPHMLTCDDKHSFDENT